MTAVFDLGSNSYISLVVDGKKDIHEEVKVTTMAFDLHDGIIKNCEKYKRIFEEMLKKVKTYTNNIHVFGTAVFRNALNGKECFEYIKDDLPGKVLSGEEEARYSFLSVLWDEELKVENPVVFDLGGGSLEIISEGKSPLSLPLGTKKVKELMEVHSLTEVLDMLVKKIPFFEGEAVGIGGTFVTLAASKLGEWNLRKVHGNIIEEKDLNPLCNALLSMSEEDLKSLPYIPDGREKTIKPGCLITLAIVKKYGKLRVSRKGYRFALAWEIEESVPGGI